MNHYEYVSEKQAGPYRQNIISMSKALQKRVKNFFTFQFHMIGSSSRHMIMLDPKTNKGFDFDIDYIIPKTIC